MIEPRPGIAEVIRLGDPVEDRTRFVCLDKNERIDPFPVEVLQALRASVDGLDISTYPVIEPFRDQVANWIGVAPGQVLLTAGSDAAIRAVFETFVSPGDRVVIPQPTFAMFGVYARLYQATLAEIDCDALLQIPVERVLAAIDDGARLICLPNPNSPTGTVIAPLQMRELARAAERTGTVLLIDEAYWEFAGRSELQLVAEHPNVVISRTFSKAAGMAGVRLGFLIGSSAMIHLLQRPKPMYEISGLALRFGDYLIRHEHLIRDYVGGIVRARSEAAGELEACGFSPFPSHANFIVAKAPDALDTTAFGQRLRALGYLIRAGYSKRPMAGSIRVSLALPATLTPFYAAVRTAIHESSL